jgi:hypothetical protein
VVLLAVLAVALLAAALAIWQATTREPPQQATAPPPADGRPAAAAPDPSPASALVEQSSDWVSTGGREPTVEPTPWYEGIETPTPSPPTPTPSFSECVHFRWSTQQVFSPSAQVMVEINAANQCRRSIGQTDLWFEVTGWRDGDMVQTVRGHPFEVIRHRRSAVIAIGLPGSIDWYDEITVEMVQ